MIKACRIMSTNSTRLRWLIWFAVINGLLAAAIAFSNVPAELLLSGDWSNGFIVFALPAHFIFIALLIALALSPAVMLLRDTRIVVALAASIYAVLIILVFMDAKVFALYRFHLNGMVWNLMTGGALQDIIAFSPLMWLLVIFLVALFIGAEVVLAFMLYKWINAKVIYKTRYLLLGFGLVMITGQLTYAWSDANGYAPITSQSRYIPWAYPLTMKNFLKKYGLAVAEDSREKLSFHSHGALDYPKEPLNCTTQAPLNIVVILIDSLRFDMLNPEVMPASWKFSRKSLNFTNHYSAGNATRFGVFGMMYGLPGSYWHTMLGEQKGSVFVKQLATQGYDFYINGSAALTNPEFHRTVFADVRDRMAAPAHGANADDRDNAIVEEFVSLIDKNELHEPFFGFLFLDAPHAFSHPKDMLFPFLPELNSVNYLELNNDYDPTAFLNLYKNALYFDDLLVSKLLAALEAKGYLDNTLVILTGDHGQEFNDLKQNYWGHNGNFSIYQIKVPLLVYWPGRGFAEYKYRTSHVDLVPTLMRKVLGCSNAVSGYSTGIDLFEGRKNRVLQADSWSSRAVLEPFRTFVFYNYGGMDVYDENYTRLPADKPNTRTVLETVERMSRFYQK